MSVAKQLLPSTEPKYAILYPLSSSCCGINKHGSCCGFVATESLPANPQCPNVQSSIDHPVQLKDNRK